MSRRIKSRISTRAQAPKVVYEPYCFYLSAWEEDKYVVAQANVSLDERLKITTELSTAVRPATSSSEPR